LKQWSEATACKSRPGTQLGERIDDRNRTKGAYATMGGTGGRLVISVAGKS